jgi:hypothetical protein
VPLEYSIEWLTCAFGSRLDVVMVSLPGAAKDRLRAYMRPKGASEADVTPITMQFPY